MKYIALLFLPFILLTNADRCDKVEEKVENTFTLGTPFELKLEEMIKLSDDNFGLQFTEMAESRCAMHTNCIRAGEAIATFQVVDTSESQTLKMEVKAYCHKDDGTCGETKTALGYKVQLLNLYPYPGSDDQGPKRAKLLIEKATSD